MNQHRSRYYLIQSWTNYIMTSCVFKATMSYNLAGLPDPRDHSWCVDLSWLPGSVNWYGLTPVNKLLTLEVTWWHHQMETFSSLLALCAENSPVIREFPSQRPVMLSFDVFFDLCLNKRLSKQSWGWWFEMPWRPWWRHCNGVPHCLTKSPNHFWCHLAFTIIN